MARFTLAQDAIASGAVVGTYASILGLKAGAAERGKLKALRIGGGGEAPADVNMSVRVIRTNNDADGTATAQTPAEKDSQGPASVMDGKHTYTVEPTTLEGTPLFVGSFNSRGFLRAEWPEGEEPVWGPAQTLLVQVTPGTASATKVDVTVEYEE